EWFVDMKGCRTGGHCWVSAILGSRWEAVLCMSRNAALSVRMGNSVGSTAKNEALAIFLRRATGDAKPTASPSLKARSLSKHGSGNGLYGKGDRKLRGACSKRSSHLCLRHFVRNLISRITISCGNGTRWNSTLPK